MTPVNRTPAQWDLFIDNEKMGVLTYHYLDQPWFHCTFQATSPFERYRELFAREVVLLEQEGGSEGEQCYEEIDALTIELRAHNGVTIDDLLLHIQGSEAWFRY